MNAATSSSLSSFKPIQFCSLHTLQKHANPNTISCIASMPNTASRVNFYKVLSLESENVGFEEIKRAYRSMALRCHPDACPASKKEEFTRMFVELHKAYETLSNPVSRRKYDCELGLCGFSETSKAYEGRAKSELSREAWEDQLAQLKMRSDFRMKQKKGSSFCSRMRSQRI